MQEENQQLNNNGININPDVDELMSDIEMKDMEDFNDIIIGNRRPRRQTNWSYCHDALSQTQCA
jgi:hypothetical protein